MLYTGKQPATYDPNDLLYAHLRTSVSLPNIPKPGGGYGMDFGRYGWGMLGNGPDDTVFPGFGGAGDCTLAGAGHEVKESCYNSRRPIPPFSGKTIIQQYSTMSGYDSHTGANDTGLVVRDVLNMRRTTGLKDDTGKAHKIGVFVALEPGNVEHLWEALWLFQAVGIGFEFPISAMDQFNNNNQIWSVVSGTQVDGGHYVPIVGHPSLNVWTCVTWGDRQTMTPGFLTKYCDEAWAWIDAERYNAVTGKTLQGFKDADLEQYLTLVSQGH